MINFLNVVLHGYANERKYFLDYLLREQKKAEAEHYQAEEFFSKCFDVVEGFKKELDRQLNERKRELYLMLSEAKNETINYGQESELSYKDRCKETKEYCEKELKDISRHNFTVLLHHYTNTSFTGHLHYDQVLEIETKISKANEAYNSEIALEEVLKKYKRTPEANLIPPYRLFRYKFDNWEKFLRFLEVSTPRYSYVLNNLPSENQIRLKNDFCDYLKEIKEAQTESKYKEYLDDYINQIEEKYQEIKKEVPLYNPEGKRQLYEKTKEVDVIFPFILPEWKFNDWNKFLWFFEVTRPTYIYIFDRLNKHEQFQLKGDFIDYLNTIIEKQTATKYIKALEGFKVHIQNFNGSAILNEDKKQTPPKENLQLRKNPFPEIFSNDLGYTLFLKMHEIYKDESKDNSNYSFLYYALEKDFLVCKGTKFIEFAITQFDVKDYTRNDSRYKEDYTRNKLFKSVKNQFKDIAQK
ncbi:hypothetical protein [Salinimicrobium sp. TH3]|uniref:hypothetical protein n=1 Tax=Salinimicrobium sp. TH3 TaxID=2997342 RepID=UPI002273B1FD|nr:hypothetical protein [Salinimicrobium sp. TH3]MCY2686771.1 hypothetical protein [Salinimicrobium sp. TH3]